MLIFILPKWKTIIWKQSINSYIQVTVLTIHFPLISFYLMGRVFLPLLHLFEIEDQSRKSHDPEKLRGYPNRMTNTQRKKRWNKSTSGEWRHAALASVLKYFSVSRAPELVSILSLYYERWEFLGFFAFHQRELHFPCYEIFSWDIYV